MADGFESSGFDKFAQELLKVAQKELPKESNKFLKTEGKKLKNKTIATAKRKVKKNTGNYYESIKAGRVYFYKPTGSKAIRVYSSAPHGHLIEYGHRVVRGWQIGRGKKTGSVVTRDGQEVFVKGKHVFEDAQRDFTSEFYNDVEKFIDDVVVKGVTK